eukprot:10222973-Karenia_brevis.AAC.1
MAAAADTLQWPNCRGPPTVKATYQHMGNHEDRSIGVDNQLMNFTMLNQAKDRLNEIHDSQDNRQGA